MSTTRLDSGKPIGIFDSGVGGLSVWSEIISLLPHEATIYLADQAHVPYGSRGLSEIQNYAKGITTFLLGQGAKLIVVACNTASGAALEALRLAFPYISFIGMEPAVKPAVELTHTHNIGVIATPTTYEGHLYKNLVKRFGQDVAIHTQICPGLVEAIEAGKTNTSETAHLLKNCLIPLKNQNIDQLVLGCTHYPFIIHLAKRILGPNVNIIDPAPAVARQTKRILQQKQLCTSQQSKATHIFYTSGPVPQLRQAAQKLIGFYGTIQSISWNSENHEISHIESSAPMSHDYANSEEG
ncbi:MAG: glutamate racemase [Anaerolineae bacterium]|nr:glutamate racemase [Anaerolineae bacterium]